MLVHINATEYIYSDGNITVDVYGRCAAAAVCYSVLQCVAVPLQRHARSQIDVHANTGDHDRIH